MEEDAEEEEESQEGTEEEQNKEEEEEDSQSESNDEREHSFTVELKPAKEVPPLLRSLLIPSYSLSFSLLLYPCCRRGWETN